MYSDGNEMSDWCGISSWTQWKTRPCFPVVFWILHSNFFISFAQYKYLSKLKVPWRFTLERFYCTCCSNNAIYRVVQHTFECAHYYSPHPICFSTAVKWRIWFTIKFQLLYKIFNTSQRTVKLNMAWDVLKIMLNILKLMMMEMKC